MEQPDASAHWTLHLAYDIDGYEAQNNWTLPVTTVPSTEILKLEEQPFAFQWLDHDGPNMIRSFTLREDGTAMVTLLSYYEQVEEGRVVLMPEYIRAELSLSSDEQNVIRKAIQAAELGRAPSKFTREGVYDGLQWLMYLRLEGRTKCVTFSNAVPERFRDLMVTVFRYVCAKHSDEIDKVQKIRGFVEFSGADLFHP